MKPYGFFVSSNGGYLPYLLVFLNGLQKHCSGQSELFEVNVIHDGTLPDKFLQDSRKYSFAVHFIGISAERAGCDPSWSSAWQCKAARYFYLRELGKGYEACCLMDADLMVTSPEILNFFPLVARTDQLIGCNERIKWNISSCYKLHGERMLPEDRRLHKFHCNVPLFLDTRRWWDVLHEYSQIVYRGIETREGKDKPIGDLYSWNLAVYREGREQDVILMPMSSMTQVHRTGYRDEHGQPTRQADGTWITKDGDPVYSLHGRPDRIGFRSMETTPGAFEKHRVSPAVFKAYSRLVERYWKELAFDTGLKLDKYVPVNPHWAEMGK